MPSEELIPARQAAESLLHAGFPPTYIARELDISVESVRAIRTFRGDTEVLSTGDVGLDDRVLELMQFAVEQAFLEIRDFTSPHRGPLIKALATRAAASVGTKGTSRLDEMRELFMDNMSGIRSPNPDLLDDDYDDDAEPDTFTLTPVDN